MTFRSSPGAAPLVRPGDRRPIGTAALILAVLAAGIDQFTKAWAKASLAGPVEVGSFLSLDLRFNRGVTFGLLSGEGEAGRWLLAALSAAIAAALLTAAWRSGRLALALPCGVVAGAALGNIVDRVRHGAVTDFIDLHMGDWRWPTFNLADVAIVCGLALLSWAFARSGKAGGGDSLA